MAVLSPAEHDRIAAAIRAAEAATDGEIFAVLARESDSYAFIAIMWAALAALLGGIATAVILRDVAALSLVLGQAAAFLALGAAAFVPSVRMWIVPRSVQEARAGRHATEQFLAHNLHATADRTGVLVFVSLAEHYAAIVADRNIDEKVPQAVWDGIVGELTQAIAAGRLADGLVAAIGAAGAVLSEHFPRTDAARNELPDRLVEI
ncbi:TPM domain-containing protein [Faunimonas sp. B44]|uniref:TPM domain-containing protein n=1 Tax=Faunimonas sp. B44 TaxID=3461493 RepID=UPI004044A661